MPTQAQPRRETVFSEAELIAGMRVAPTERGPVLGAGELAGAKWRRDLQRLRRQAVTSAISRTAFATLVVAVWTAFILYYVLGYQLHVMGVLGEGEDSAMLTGCIVAGVVVGGAIFGYLHGQYRMHYDHARELLDGSQLPLIIADHAYSQSIAAYFPKPIVDASFRRVEHLKVEDRIRFGASAFPLILQFYQHVPPEDKSYSKLHLRSNDIPVLATQQAICDVLLGEGKVDDGLPDSKRVFRLKDPYQGPTSGGWLL